MREGRPEVDPESGPDARRHEDVQRRSLGRVRMMDAPQDRQHERRHVGPRRVEVETLRGREDAVEQLAIHRAAKDPQRDTVVEWLAGCATAFDLGRSAFSSSCQAWWRQALTWHVSPTSPAAYQPILRSDTLPTAQAEDPWTNEPDRGAIYRRIGVEPIINGATTMTYLGGSLMPPEVVEAMRAGRPRLRRPERTAGRRRSPDRRADRNEAAFVSGGAAAGLFLSAIVCMSRDTADAARATGRPRRPATRVPHPPRPPDPVRPRDRARRRAARRDRICRPAPRWPTWNAPSALGRRPSSSSPARIWRGGALPLETVVRDRASPRRPGDRRRGRPAAAGREPLALHGGRRRHRAVQRRQGAARSRQHRARPRPSPIRRPVRRRSRLHDSGSAGR